MTRATDSFTIRKTETKTDGMNAGVYLDPDHELFAGHFPGNPVMPGVLNIEIMRELLKGPFPGQEIAEVASIKFLQPVRPVKGIDLTYELSWKKTEDGSVKVTSTGILNEAVFVKMQLKLHAKKS